jgi:hypothetical protein
MPIHTRFFKPGSFVSSIPIQGTKNVGDFKTPNASQPNEAESRSHDYQPTLRQPPERHPKARN